MTGHSLGGAQTHEAEEGRRQADAADSGHPGAGHHPVPSQRHSIPSQLCHGSLTRLPLPAAPRLRRAGRAADRRGTCGMCAPGVSAGFERVALVTRAARGSAFGARVIEGAFDAPLTRKVARGAAEDAGHAAPAPESEAPPAAAAAAAGGKEAADGVYEDEEFNEEEEVVE